MNLVYHSDLDLLQRRSVCRTGERPCPEQVSPKKRYTFWYCHYLLILRLSSPSLKVSPWIGGKRCEESRSRRVRKTFDIEDHSRQSNNQLHASSVPFAQFDLILPKQSNSSQPHRRSLWLTADCKIQFDLASLSLSSTLQHPFDIVCRRRMKPRRHR